MAMEAAFAVTPGRSPSGITGIRAEPQLQPVPAAARGPSQAGTAQAGAARAALALALGLPAATSVRSALRKQQRRVRRAPLRVTTLDRPKNLEEVSEGVFQRTDLRNLAIIAHVDHGKTTLTDALMKQCGDGKELQSMDSNDLEAERGITILAKNAAVQYKGIKINIIDTPGHADFGGEVERILNMADGCVLLVDAQEGPMPQTKFVLRKALELEKKTMVVINKVDKPAARPDWVLDTTFDLFANLGADDELCDFPVCYASGIQGKASADNPKELEGDLSSLLDLILEEVPKPKVDIDKPLQMLVANLDYDDYLGRISIGRLSSGSLKIGQKISLMYGKDGAIRSAKIANLWCFQDNQRVPVDEVSAGDICAFSGLDDVVIGDTVVDAENPKPLPPIEVEEPTVAMEFGVNRSPYVGKDEKSKFVTGTQIARRLEKECLTNLALRLEEGETADTFTVKGRGTLQLGILMENLRREGFEVMVGAPEVLYRKDEETGQKQEPYEEAVIECSNAIQGTVMEEFQSRGGMMKSMESGSVEDTLVFTYEIPTANLIGMQGRIMRKTSGQAVMTTRFSHWGEANEEASKLRDRGAIVNVTRGKATNYALDACSSRGDVFINAGDEVYDGMVIGLHNRVHDLSLNVTKEKGVSNVRAGGTSGPSKTKAAEGIEMDIDDFLGIMERDECLEVTPGKLRLAKKNGSGDPRQKK